MARWRIWTKSFSLDCAILMILYFSAVCCDLTSGDAKKAPNSPGNLIEDAKMKCHFQTDQPIEVTIMIIKIK